MKMPARFIALAAALIMGLIIVFPALANGVSTLVQFDPEQAELPEGIAVDKGGNIFVGLALTGEIKKVTPEGDVQTFAQLPSPGGGFMVGLAIDRGGHVYAAMSSFDPETHGIWKIHRNGHMMELFTPLDVSSLPNDMVFDERGNLFVTDSTQGQVWKIDRRGHAAVWVADALLEGVVGPPLGIAIGANGITFDADERNLYVANSNFGRIVRVPVTNHGMAGKPEVYAEDPILSGADGITFDHEGRLFVAATGTEVIAVISEDGEDVTVLAEDELLDFPANVRFGRGDHEDTLYIANFAFLRFAGIVEGDPNPALLTLDVDDDD